MSAKTLQGKGQRTILIVENHGLNIPWLEPRDLDLETMDYTIDSPHGISSPYVGPAVALADCSVVPLQPTISRETLRAMLSIDGSKNVAWSQEDGWQIIPDGRLRPEK